MFACFEFAKLFYTCCACAERLLQHISTNRQVCLRCLLSFASESFCRARRGFHSRRQCTRIEGIWVGVLSLSVSGLSATECRIEKYMNDGFELYDILIEQI